MYVARMYSMMSLIRLPYYSDHVSNIAKLYFMTSLIRPPH